jgi:ubiquinone/menaquinone biosynthesis C-methylase UbiE
LGECDLISSTEDSAGAEVEARWEATYRNGAQLNLYPFDSVVAWFSSRFRNPSARAQVSVLEVGCGAGNNLWFLARAGFRCAGIDISSAAIDFARSRLTTEGLAVDLRVGSFAELPFGDQAFEVVLDRGGIACVDLETGRAAIAEIARVLRPGGVFIFSPFSEGASLPADKKQQIGCVYDRDKVLQVLPERQWRISKWTRTETRDELAGEITRVLWWIEAERLAGS